jgi:hypothetical protein
MVTPTHLTRCLLTVPSRYGLRLSAAKVRWAWVALLIVGGVAACGGNTLAPGGMAPGDPTSGEKPATVEPSPTATPQPTPTPDGVTQAPTATPPTPAMTLPDHLVQQWEPTSNVLTTFGPMTVTAGQVEWGSGQRSAYTLISADDGFLLRLEANPKFYDTPNPYIKLIPKTDPAGGVTAVEVAFYESEAQMQKDEYIMYGSYFVN